MCSLLEVKNITKCFSKRLSGFFYKKKETFAALQDVSFSLDSGESMGLIGESGSGKTTVANILLRLIEADQGQVLFNGEDITRLHGYKQLYPIRRNIQAVFQNSGTSLDSHMTLEDIITEPLRNYNLPTKRRAEESLELVGLPSDWAKRKPYQLSGGQRQRVSIARAMVLKPSLLILDEATSNLDVITSSQILALMRRLHEENQTAILFISHDISAVDKLCTKKAVMKDGRIVETLRSLDLNEASHPYTRKLIESKMSVSL